MLKEREVTFGVKTLRRISEGNTGCWFCARRQQEGRGVWRGWQAFVWHSGAYTCDTHKPQIVRKQRLEYHFTQIDRFSVNRIVNVEEE